MAPPERKHRTGPSSGTPGPDGAGRRRNTGRSGTGLWSLVRPAVATVKGGILTAGAVAGAVAAVIALVPKNEPLQIRFTSLSVSPAPVPASAFTAVRSGSRDADRGVSRRGVALGPIVGADDASTTGPDPGSAGTAAPEASPAGPSEQPTPSVTEPSPSGAPSSTSPTPSPSTSPPVTSHGSRPGVGRPDLPASHATQVLRRVDDQFRLGNCDGPNGLCKALVQGSETDPEGNPVPPRVAAQRVVKVLSHVRSRPVVRATESGEPAAVPKRDPLGVVVRANVDLVHGQGQPIEIRWEILDASSGEVQSLSREWLRDLAAYELLADTDPDSAFFKLWVPLPEQRGDYVISLTARTDGDRLPLAEKSTETVVH